MPTGWRIVKSRYAGRAFSGEGARLFGGRWNSPGTPMVYTSGSVALATLEMLVHLNDSGLLSTYVLFSVHIEAAHITRVEHTRLPANWRDYPAPPVLQAIGDAWIANRTSVVLEVPSAVVESESNYLLNPAHEDFASLRIEGPFKYHLDPRLTGS